MKLRPSICLTTALLLVAFAGCNEPNTNPAGTWKWVAPTNPDGGTPDITFTLKLQDGVLTGTRTSGAGRTVNLTNGGFNGDEVSFQTPRHQASSPRRTVSYEAYSGKFSGDTIKGTVEIYVNDNLFSSQGWEVKRVKE